jgi:hypothetical protein
MDDRCEITITRTRPIEIFQKQYKLNHSLFDPTQNSPPSIWKMRLNSRIKSTKVHRAVQDVNKT